MAWFRMTKLLRAISREISAEDAGMEVPFIITLAKSGVYMRPKGKRKALFLTFPELWKLTKAYGEPLSEVEIWKIR